MMAAGLSLITCLLALSAQSACGDKITVDGVMIVVPPVITWDANVDEAIQVAKIKRKPFAIYFVSKENSKIIGESFDAIKEYMKANNNTVPSYLDEVPIAIDQVRELGVGNFVKVALRKDTKEIVQRYGGEENTLILCTPSGEKMIAFKCTTEALKNMDSVKKELAAWQAKNPQAPRGQ